MDDPHLAETLENLYQRLDHPKRLELVQKLNNQDDNQQRYTAHALNALKQLQQIENTYQTGIKSEFVEKLSSRQKELTHSNKYLEPLRYQPKQIDQENQNQNTIKPPTLKPF